LSYFFGPEADSVQVDPVQYPDRKVIERCAVIRDFSNKEDLEKVLEMWSRVKGDNLNTGIVLIIFAVFGGLFVWLIISKVNKYRRNMQRKKGRRRKKRK
jgi:spermidine/putrescine transport system substrate-binding protein